MSLKQWLLLKSTISVNNKTPKDLNKFTIIDLDIRQHKLKTYKLCLIDVRKSKFGQ
jgi:hypothetical protein